MNTSYKTHIEESISTWEKLVNYDIEIYLGVIKGVFLHHHINTKEQIEAFWVLYDLSIGDKSISYYYDDNKWHFDQITNPYLIYYCDDGKKVFHDATKKRILSVISDNSKNEISLLLDTIGVPQKVKNKVSRTLVALRMCREVFADIESQATDEWGKYLMSSIKEDESRWSKLSFIIQASLFYSKNYDTASIELSKISQEFFYNIIKSLLNAEYLILDNYSSLLDNVLHNVKTPIEEEEDDRMGLIFPWFVKSFVLIIRYEKEMCFRINKIIRQEGNYRINIDYHADEYVENQFSSCYFVHEKPTRIYENFVRSVVDMTMIDYLNKVNTHNIESLLLLWRRSDFLNKSSISNKTFANVVEMIRIKTAVILSSMLKQSKNPNTYKFYLSLGDKHMEEILRELKEYSQKINYTENEFITKRLESKNKKLNIDNLDNDVEWINTNKDLSAYDIWTKKGRDIYASDSNLIEKVCCGKNDITTIKTDEIENILDSIEEFCGSANKTSYFYQKTIDFLYAIMESQKFRDDISISRKTLNLLSKLVSEAREYNSNSENSLSPYYLPPFNNSFYCYNESKADFVELSCENIREYNKNDFFDKFFYASLCSPLLNPFMFSRLIEKYSNKLPGLVYDFTCRIDDNTKIELEKKDKLITEQKTDLERVSERLSNENLHTRNHTIQLVGLFAIFMAFITSVIGSIRVAKNVPEFIIFSLTFLAGVALFSILILDFGKKKEDTNDQTKKDNNLRWWVLGIIIALAIAVMSIYPIYSSNISQQEKENVSQPSENNATNYIEIESNAIIIPIIDTMAKYH